MTSVSSHAFKIRSQSLSPHVFLVESAALRPGTILRATLCASATCFHLEALYTQLLGCVPVRLVLQTFFQFADLVDATLVLSTIVLDEFVQTDVTWGLLEGICFGLASFRCATLLLHGAIRVTHGGPTLSLALPVGTRGLLGRSTQTDVVVARVSTF